MPISLEKLKKFENFQDIETKILELLKKNKGYGFNFDELEFSLKKEKSLGLKVGGKFFVNNTLRNLVKENKVKSIISKGKEFFFME